MGPTGPLAIRAKLFFPCRERRDLSRAYVKQAPHVVQVCKGHASTIRRCVFARFELRDTCALAKTLVICP